jgi:hypothetical protein
MLELQPRHFLPLCEALIRLRLHQLSNFLSRWRGNVFHLFVFDWIKPDSADVTDAVLKHSCLRSFYGVGVASSGFVVVKVRHAQISRH